MLELIKDYNISLLHSGHTINEEESRMEVNNKMKHTIKVAWAKGFSQF